MLSIPPACDDERLGPVLVGCFALDTASEVVMGHWGRYWWDALLPIPPVGLMHKLLGPVLMDALLPIPPVGLMHKLLGPVLTDALLPIPPVIIGLSEFY